MEKYVKPAMEIVEIELEQSILSGSPSDNESIPGLPGDPSGDTSRT